MIGNGCNLEKKLGFRILRCLKNPCIEVAESVKFLSVLLLFVV